MSQFHITTQDSLPGPDGDEPYVLFVNQTEYGNARFLRTNVLSARPDLKKYTALRFRQEVKRHADAAGPGEDVVLVFMEALGLEPPLTLVCRASSRRSSKANRPTTSSSGGSRCTSKRSAGIQTSTMAFASTSARS